MENEKISLRPENQAKVRLILPMIYEMIDGLENVNQHREIPLFDITTINAIRASLKIFEGWEEVYLNTAFLRGMDIGTDPNRPMGLMNKEVYCYTEDFFFTKDESK
jgi:hypothetical protein